VSANRRQCKALDTDLEQLGTEGSAASTPGSVRFDSNDPKSLISATCRLVDEALSLLEHAKNAGDSRTALTALREARDGLSLLMKTAGMLGSDGATVNIVDARRQSVALLSKLTEDELRAIAAMASGVPALGSAEIIDVESTPIDG
jgi:hypothetical protein